MAMAKSYYQKKITVEGGSMPSFLLSINQRQGNGLGDFTVPSSERASLVAVILSGGF